MCNCYICRGEYWEKLLEKEVGLEEQEGDY